MTFAQLEAALGNVRLTQALVGAALGIGLETHNQVAPYPAATAANAPRGWTSGGDNSWYERGFGTRYAVKSGAVRGRQTSQTLGRRWTVQPSQRGAVVRNAASYAGFVQSAAHQTAAMKRIGWTTDKQAVERVLASGVIPKLVGRALAAAFRGAVA